MRLLLDENLPRALKSALEPHETSTVQELGWGALKNGALVERAEASFDVLLTADKNLRYQQNLKERRIAIVELPTNRKRLVLAMTAEIHSALRDLERTGTRYVTIPFDRA